MATQIHNKGNLSHQKGRLSHQKVNKQPKQMGDFIIGKVLGQGTFGKVRLGIHKPTQQKVAIKFLQKKKIIQVSDVQRVSRQLHILKLLRHPHLIHLYQIIQTPKQLLLIMQYMQKGQLFDHIVEKKRLSQDEGRKMFQQILDGVDYLHRIGITHRDLKPENILRGWDGRVKIVDFGLSNTFKLNQMLKTPCGSPCYAAPEMIQGEKYDGAKVDIWSCGIILFAMLCGYLPFQDENVSTLYKKILQGDYTFHRSVSKDARDLIIKILTNKPCDRLTIQQIRCHPFMRPNSLKQKSKNTGIIIGYNKIPIDQQILKQITKYSSYDLDYVQKCLQANRHNEATVTYYLQMKKFMKQGGKSKYDIGNDNFDHQSLQPIKRKDNNTQILIDNFFTKSSCAGSTDITNSRVLNQKRHLKSKTPKQNDNKQNISFYVNRKKSKDKSSAKNKDKSRQIVNIKKVLKQSNEQLNNSSNLKVNSNTYKTINLKQSIDKRSESRTKKTLRSGSQSSKVNMNKKKLGKGILDNSISEIRVPMTKSIQKRSGREQQQSMRVSILQNRISRKYKQDFNKSLISKSKLKPQTQRSRINSASIAHKQIKQIRQPKQTKQSKQIKLGKQNKQNKQNMNTSVINGYTHNQNHKFTTIVNVHTYSGSKGITKNVKDHDASMGFVEEYLMKGRKTQELNPKKKKTNQIQSHQVSKIMESSAMALKMGKFRRL